MFSYRLIHDLGFSKKRSFCPKCHKTINWYDNIPIISWLILGGKCRSCKKAISVLYPFIELLSTIIFVLLSYKFTFPYVISYFILFSALLVTIRSDLETMQISAYMTIYLIPLSFLLSILKAIHITFPESILGTIFGYGLLFIISKVFTLLTGKHGMGQGDLELLAFIGSFTGIVGCWMTLLMGSILGSIVGLTLMLISKKVKFSTQLPFGPFLAFSAIIYVLYSKEILAIIFLR